MTRGVRGLVEDHSRPEPAPQGRSQENPQPSITFLPSDLMMEAPRGQARQALMVKEHVDVA